MRWWCKILFYFINNDDARFQGQCYDVDKIPTDLTCEFGSLIIIMFIDYDYDTSNKVGIKSKSVI